MFLIRKAVFKTWRALSAVIEGLLGKTSLGVRILALRGDEVLLVRMTYLRDWYLPGGGVDRGESLRAAALRELREETAYEASGLELHGIYFNGRKQRSDHVALFVTRNLSAVPGLKPDHEIAEVGFFRTDALPEGTSPATRARIAEVVAGLAPAEFW